MLQNIFAIVLGGWTHVEDRRWLNVKQNIFANVLQMFYFIFTCNHGLKLGYWMYTFSADTTYL